MPQRIVQQEVHHVVLGEQLGHRRDLRRADLLPTGVHLVLALRLPELVGPTKAVVGGEDLGGQLVQQGPQGHLVVGGEAQLQHGIIAAEHTGEDLARKAAGQLEAVAGAQFWSQLIAIGQGHRHVAVGGIGAQQIVLGEEAREEQAVPMLVGGIGHQMLQPLVAIGIALISCSTPPGAKSVAQQALLHAHVGAVFALVHGEVLQGGAHGLFGLLPRMERGAGKEVAEVFGEGGHGRVR